jgi:hypothetical protein
MDRHVVRAATLLSALMTSALALAGCEPREESPPVLTNQFALRDDYRQLWTGHATWTRVVIVSTVAGLDDTSAATARLTRNAADIADAIRPFYGDDAAYRLHALLNDHLTGTQEVLASLMQADNPGLESSTTFWYANADDTARFLADLNPELDYYALYRAMSAQLDATMAEMRARIGGEYDADIAAHDALVVSSRELADTLAEGTSDQLPQLVSPRTFASVREVDLHLSMRVAWNDEVSWTRFYLIDALAGLPSTPETTARLYRSAERIADTVRQLYGSPAADQLSELLQASTMSLIDVTNGLAANDQAAVGLAQSHWYANARETAQFLSTLTDEPSARAIETLLTEHLDLTTQEAIERSRGDWEADISAYDLVVAQVLTLSDALASGIARDVGSPVPAAI